MIKFNYVEAKNFLSIGATPAKFILNSDPTTLVKGTNGAGKTTSLESICYTLFNKPLRNIKLNQLVNSVNKKKMLCEINFDINSVNYTVQRGQKPAVFKVFVNGEALDEDAAAKDLQAKLENEILKCNYKTFTQVVFMASTGFTYFMELSPAERRNVVESMLDIEVIGNMSQLMKEKYKSINIKKTTIDSSTEVTKTKVAAKQELVDNLSVVSEEQIANLVQQKETKDIEFNKFMKEIEEINSKDLVLPDAPVMPIKPIYCKPELPAEPDKIEAPTMPNKPELVVSDLPEKPKQTDLSLLYSKKSDLLSKKQTLIDSAENKKQVASFYQDNTNCDRCHQVITEEFKKTVIDETNNELNKLREDYVTIENQLSIIDADIEEGTKLNNIYSDWEKECIAIKNNDNLKNSENIHLWEKECNKLTGEYNNAVNSLMDEWKQKCSEIELKHNNTFNQELSLYNTSVNELNTKYNQECEKIKSARNNEVSIINNNIMNSSIIIRDLNAQISDLRVKQNNNSELHYNELKDLNNTLTGLISESANVNEELELCSLGVEMLKDTGIKAKIIQQYLPTINNSINEFLDQMGANYSFVLDESFNETIKSRYRDVYSYGSFSNGEKSRINFAIMLMWQKLAKSKNTVSSNLLFIDEILDGSLDNDGIHAIMNIFDSMRDSNIFVVSHRKEIQDYFDAVLEVSKVGNFSNYNITR